MRVLVAEHRPGLREILTWMCKAEAGVALVLPAGSGPQALALTWQHGPDLVLLDVNLPGPPAPEITRTVRAACPHTCVVALASWDERPAADAVLAAGAMGPVVISRSMPAIWDAVRTYIANLHTSRSARAA